VTQFIVERVFAWYCT